ncbi:MAG: DUF3971 domain-containing protein, partial [Geminicoccaceae bacterium]
MVRRGLKVVIAGSAVLITVLVLVLGFAAWQLSQGPLRFTWFVPYIERALSPEDGSFAIVVGDTAIRLSEVGYDLDLVGTDVRAQMPDGLPLFDLPEIKLGLSPWALLRRGLFAVTDLELQKPQLRMVRSVEGASSTGPDTPDASFLKTLLDAASGSSDPDQPLFYLKKARVLNGTVIYEDVDSDQTETIRNIELDLTRQTDGFDLDLNFVIAQSEQPALGRLRGQFDNATGWLDATLSLKDLLPASLADLLSAKPLGGLDLSVSLEAAGRLHVDGSTSGIDVAIVADPGTLTMPDQLAYPLSIEMFALHGSLAPDLGGLTIDGLDATINGSGLTVQGTLSWQDGLDLAADLEATQITKQTLDRFWPLGLAEKTRDWALSNIKEGILPHARAKLRLQPGDIDQKALPDNAISGTFTFEELDLSYHEPLPPLVGAAGEASFTAQFLVFDLREGRIGGLTVESGTVDITRIGVPGGEAAQLSVDTTIEGPFRQALALIRQIPVDLDELGSDLDNATGQVQTRLKLGLPLHHDVADDEIQLDAQAQFRDIGIKDLRADLDLTEGQLQVAATREALEITGTGTVGGLPLSISGHENFDTSAAVRRRYKLSGEVTPEALRQFQLELPISLAGTAPLEAEVEQDQDGRKQVRLSVDLKPIAISAPSVDWQKPAGEPGRLEADWHDVDRGIVVDRLDLSGGDLELRAKARL